MNLEPLFRMTVDLGRRHRIGQVPKGTRNVWELTGGKVVGPKLQGIVLPLGGEFELVDGDRVCHIDVRLVIQTEFGSNIYVQYYGVAETPAAVREKYKNGDVVDFGEGYFITQPRFETGDPELSWLNHTIAIAEGRGHASGVEYLVYRAVPDSAIGLEKAGKVFSLME